MAAKGEEVKKMIALDIPENLLDLLEARRKNKE